MQCMGCYVTGEWCVAHLLSSAHPFFFPRLSPISSQLTDPTNTPPSSALARYSQTVEDIDVSEAMTLVRNALQAAATDPRTGLIDYSLIATGKSNAERNLIGDLVK